MRRWCLGVISASSRWCLGGALVRSQWCLKGVLVVARWCPDSVESWWYFALVLVVPLRGLFDISVPPWCLVGISMVSLWPSI